jgi:hypothetical protein
MKEISKFSIKFLKILAILSKYPSTLESTMMILSIPIPPNAARLLGSLLMKEKITKFHNLSHKTKATVKHTPDQQNAILTIFL